MKRMILTLTLGLATTGAFAGVVRLDAFEIRQGGSGNRQEIDLGSEHSTRITLRSVLLSQTSSASLQAFEIGATSSAGYGAELSVHIAQVIQSQAGRSNTQLFRAGRPSGAGGESVSVVARNVTQRQSGEFNLQQLRMGSW